PDGPQNVPTHFPARSGSLTLCVTAQIALNLIVVPGKIEGEHPFLRHKNQPPSQTCAAFVGPLSEFAD
ncbi:MAG: hypothetical protein WCS01_09155, partial [bacterium]